MATQRIPCSDCADKKEEIELGGRFRVTSCEPIAGQEGWCLITYERVTGGVPAAREAPARKPAAKKALVRKAPARKRAGH